jgi:hypothetical protein
MIVFSRIFTAHPEAVGESYFEHMIFALRFSGRLFRAAFAAPVHGFVPGVCETTASRTVLEMNDELRVRRALLAAGAEAHSESPALARSAISRSTIAGSL